jgi:hypothetical protein
MMLSGKVVFFELSGKVVAVARSGTVWSSLKIGE